MAILIVDDAATDRFALALMLNDAGYTELLLAGSAAEAIACLAQRSPDDVELILTDLNMPGVNGIAACRQIKAMPAWPDIIADHFAAVTVLFADIVGFTELAAGVAPEALVSMLNEVFSRFDLLAEQHGLEKIKTIGDSYMAVGGLPMPRPDHASAVARM